MTGPGRLKVKRTDNGVQVQWRWARPSSGVYILLASLILLSPVLGAVYALQMLVQGISIGATLAVLLCVALVGLLLGIYLLWIGMELINQTSLLIAGETLTLNRGPLWPAPRQTVPLQRVYRIRVLAGNQSGNTLQLLDQRQKVLLSLYRLGYGECALLERLLREELARV